MGILHNISTCLVVIFLASPTIERHKYEDEAMRRATGTRLRDQRIRRETRIVRSAMEPYSKPVIVARTPSVVPKQKHIEPLPSGYAVRELCNDSEGYYWYVVIAFEFARPAKPANRIWRIFSPLRGVPFP